jgi:hypothetical protein
VGVLFFGVRDWVGVGFNHPVLPGFSSRHH